MVDESKDSHWVPPQLHDDNSEYSLVAAVYGTEQQDVELSAANAKLINPFILSQELIEYSCPPSSQL